MNFYAIVLLLISVPVFIWFVLRSFLPKWLTPPAYSAAIAVLFYIQVIIGAMYFERKVVADLVAFDNAHAGLELTADQKEIRQEMFLRVIHDTGRTFAPITGAIGAVLYFILTWLTIHSITTTLFRPSSNNSKGEH